MKDDNDKLEDLLRAKVGEKQYDFNEAHWLKARKYIDAQRSKRKRVRWFMLGGSLVLTGFISLGFYFASDNTSTSTFLNAPGIESRNRNNNTTSAQEQIIPAHITGPEALQPVTAGKNHIAEDGGAVKYKQSSSTSAGLSAPGITSRAVMPPAEHLVTGERQGSLPMQQATIEYSTAPAGTEPSIPAAGAEEASASRILLNDPLLISSLKFTGFIIPDFDCDSCRNARFVVAGKIESDQQKRYFSLEAGATWFNATQPGDALGLAAGFTFTQFFTPSLGIRTGLSYIQLAQDNGSRAYARTSYDFGRTNATLFLVTKRLDYIELPLELIYSPGRIFTLHAGAAYLHLLQTAELIQTRDEAGNIIKTSNGNGYFDAQHAYDIALKGGIGIALGRKLYLDLSFYNGLTDVTNNAIYRNTTWNNNVGVKTVIGFKLY